MSARPPRTEDGLTIIYSYDQLPEFKSEAEEHEFWSTHSLSEELMDAATGSADAYPLPPARKGSSAVNVLFEQDTLRRLKRLARAKGMGYQTLLKAFVQERLYEEEKSSGLR